MFEQNFNLGIYRNEDQFLFVKEWLALVARQYELCPVSRFLMNTEIYNWLHAMILLYQPVYFNRLIGEVEKWNHLFISYGI